MTAILGGRPQGVTRMHFGLDDEPGPRRRLVVVETGEEQSLLSPPVPRLQIPPAFTIHWRADM